MGGWTQKTQTCSEGLLEHLAEEPIDSHLQQNFNHVPPNTGNTESEWAMFNCRGGCFELWPLGGGHPGLGRVTSWRKSHMGPCWLVVLQRQLMSICGPSRPNPGCFWDSEIDCGKSLVKPLIKTLNPLRRFWQTIRWGTWRLFHPYSKRIAEVVKKLCCGRAQRLDEISPEMLKALDVVRLSWLTLHWHQWQCHWIGRLWWWLLYFKKMDKDVFQLLGTSPTGKGCWSLINGGTSDSKGNYLQLHLNIRGCVSEYLALVVLGLVGISPSESVSV